jgi:PAS domain S-box-containing protein
MKISLLKNFRVTGLLVLVIFIALLGIVGWGTNRMHFTQYSEFYTPIAPSTAYAFIILALVLFLTQVLPNTKLLKVSLLTLISLVIGFSLLVILRDILKLPANMEQFLHKGTAGLKPEDYSMSQFTAMLFVVESLAAICIVLGKVGHRKVYYGLVSFTSIFLSTVLVLGYLTGEPLLYTSSLLPVALPTAIAFFALSVVFFLIVDFQFWPFTVIFTTTTEGRLSRTFFPVIVFILLVYIFIFNTIIENTSNPTLLATFILLFSIPFVAAIIIKVSKDIGKDIDAAEKQKQEADKRLINAIVDAPFPIIIHSKGKILQISKTWTDITGYTLSEIPTIAVWGEKAYGSDAHKMVDYINLLYSQNEKTEDGLWEITTKSGEKRTWNFKTNPIGSTHDGHVILSSMAVDLTEMVDIKAKLKEKADEIEAQNEEYKQVNIELKNAMNASVEQKQQLDTLINNLQGMVYHCENDKDWTMRYVSDGCIDLCGYTEEDLIGNMNITWNEIIVESDREKIRQIIDKAIEDREVFSLIYKIRCKNNSIKTVREQGQCITINDELVLEGIITDITALKDTEAALLKAKELSVQKDKQFKSYTENSSVAIYTTDEHGGCIYANKKWLEFAGLTLDEALGNGWVAAIHPEDKEEVFTAWEKFVKKPDEWFCEYRFIDKKGMVTWVEATAIPLYNDDNKIIGYLGANIDITKRRSFQEELIKAKNKAEESDRLKTEFINNMSHEIRTPMNGILGFSDFLRDPEIIPEKQDQFVSIIQNSGKQLVRIIDDILEISRLGTKQIEAHNTDVCLNDLLLELFSIFDIKAKENNTPLYLKKGLNDAHSHILTDKTKLHKVISNLLENAIKFTNEGYVDLGYYIEDNDIVIYVKDTGIGIAKEKQEIIFERFSQAEKSMSRRFGGLGLGLSIAKENAELIGGRISLESDVNQGSMFKVTIPYEPVLMEGMDDNASRAALGPQFNILIAEDEEVNYLFLEILLLKTLKLDAKIIHAIDGRVAVDICQKQKDIDLVFMDLKMPEFNGFEATAEIKKLRPELTVIAQTAYSTIEDRELAFEAGCDDFISKPINQKELQKLVEKYLPL